MATPLTKLADAVRRKRRNTTGVAAYLVHPAPRDGRVTTAVAPGVKAVGLSELIEQL
jgi:hypothetical protein